MMKYSQEPVWLNRPDLRGKSIAARVGAGEHTPTLTVVERDKEAKNSADLAIKVIYDPQSGTVLKTTAIGKPSYFNEVPSPSKGYLTDEDITSLRPCKTGEADFEVDIFA